MAEGLFPERQVVLFPQLGLRLSEILIQIETNCPSVTLKQAMYMIPPLLPISDVQPQLGCLCYSLFVYTVSAGKYRKT